MFRDECGDFSDVFSETSKVIHRQVEHQIRFHSLPREPSSDQSRSGWREQDKTVCCKGKKPALHPAGVANTFRSELLLAAGNPTEFKVVRREPLLTMVVSTIIPWRSGIDLPTVSSPQ
jgi:hypothetical protein